MQKYYSQLKETTDSCPFMEHYVRDATIYNNTRLLIEIAAKTAKSTHLWLCFQAAASYFCGVVFFTVCCLTGTTSEERNAGWLPKVDV